MKALLLICTINFCFSIQSFSQTDAKSKLASEINEMFKSCKPPDTKLISIDKYCTIQFDNGEATYQFNCNDVGNISVTPEQNGTPAFWIHCKKCISVSADKHDDKYMADEVIILLTSRSLALKIAAKITELKKLN